MSQRICEHILTMLNSVNPAISVDPSPNPTESIPSFDVIKSESQLGHLPLPGWLHDVSLLLVNVENSSHQ